MKEALPWVGLITQPPTGSGGTFALLEFLYHVLVGTGRCQPVVVAPESGGSRRPRALLLPRDVGGLVVNEAQIFGLPAIVADAVGCREDLITPGGTGLVFPAGEADAFAAAMMELASDPGRARETGRNARRRSRRFTVEKATDGIVRALYAVTGRGAPGAVAVPV